MAGKETIKFANELAKLSDKYVNKVNTFEYIGVLNTFMFNDLNYLSEQMDEEFKKKIIHKKK